MFRRGTRRLVRRRYRKQRGRLGCNRHPEAGYAISLASKGGPTMSGRAGLTDHAGHRKREPGQSLVAANNPNAHAPKPAQAFYPQYAQAVYVGGVDPGESRFAGNYTIVTNTAAIVPPTPPTLAAPTINGTLQEGVTLSASGAVSTGGGTPTLQWQGRISNGTNFVAINGATGSNLYPDRGRHRCTTARVVATTVAKQRLPHRRHQRRYLAVVTDNLTLTQPAITGTDTRSAPGSHRDHPGRW